MLEQIDERKIQAHGRERARAQSSYAQGIDSNGVPVRQPAMMSGGGVSRSKSANDRIGSTESFDSAQQARNEGAQNNYLHHPVKTPGMVGAEDAGDSRSLTNALARENRERLARFKQMATANGPQRTQGVEKMGRSGTSSINTTTTTGRIQRIGMNIGPTKGNLGLERSRPQGGLSKIRGFRTSARGASLESKAISSVGHLLFFFLLIGIVILKDILDPFIDLLISGAFAAATAASAATFGIATPVAYGIVFFLWMAKILVALVLFVLMVTYRFVRFMQKKSIGGALRAMIISSIASLLDFIPFVSILPWQTVAMIANEILDTVLERVKRITGPAVRTVGGMVALRAGS